MEETNVAEFKLACGEELKKWGVAALRTYGRNIGMRCPTKLTKVELIEQIIGVLCGEIVQVQTKQGAPVKNHYIDEKSVERIELIKRKYLKGEEPLDAEPIVINENEIPPKEKPSTATVVLRDGNGRKILSFSFDIKL